MHDASRSSAESAWRAAHGLSPRLRVSAPPPPNLLEVRDVAKRFGETRALRGASFGVRRGEVLALIGPNGSGKSTLLECVAGLLDADAGEVLTYDGGRGGDGARALSPRERRDVLFYLPDAIAPWPDQTVSWALRFAAVLHGGRDAAPSVNGLVSELVDALDLAPFLERRIGALSKGQRKRALLALALLTPQPLLVLDEPFDGLDLRQTREVTALLRRVAAGGRALLLSIHQLGDAVRVSDRLALLSDGRVVGEGTLDELRGRVGLPPAAGLEDVFLALT